jgi:hypothetical protein
MKRVQVSFYTQANVSEHYWLQLHESGENQLNDVQSGRRELTTDEILKNTEIKYQAVQLPRSDSKINFSNKEHYYSYDKPKD